ncbi:hypothetical protein G8770_03525 [Aestuariicella hydrocarbonica]|uniref:Ubiquitin-activating enzyme E1 FCCH domain-containing protein n=1 Tax=Pseudomaricurvus hydrocarbonicus TaxID=1470433 RepID=A0A9E5JTK9_9GAMM|nr:DUF2460 domain-containing protein [Aestuariicella hydrocarbonica]NHO64615.1 hypothetical protein [Aestuariicella hydrocarbonica]
MARPFFEASILECARMGSDYSEHYSVTESQTSSGDTYAKLDHPYPVLRMTFDLSNTHRDKYREDVTTLYHKCQGQFGGFRLRHDQDYSTNNYVDVPTATDQICLATATANVFQMVRWYGTQGDPTQAHRRLRKPVVGTGLVSIEGVTIASGYSIDYTTGEITFTNKTDTITGINKGITTTINTIAHPYAIGDFVHVSGVVGMTEINGLRGTVLSVPDVDNIIIDIDSSAFTDYVSDGTLNTTPQTGETVRTGAYFDIPVHFMDALNGNYNNANVVSGSFALEELLNP